VAILGLVKLFTSPSTRVSGAGTKSLEEFASRLGFWDTASFQRLLDHERRRSRRNNQPLSAVGLRYRASPGASSDEPDLLVWRRMLEGIAHHARDTDLKHFDGDEITVLLPETSAARASAAAARLASLIGRRLEGLLPAGQVEHGLIIRHWVVTEDRPASAGDSEPPAPAGGEERTDVGGARVDDRAGSGMPTRRSRLLQRATVKRTIDIVGASMGILLVLPLMAVIGVAIRLTSPGPALFRQPRLGHRGRRFLMLKFRTMRANGDDQIHREYLRRLIENGEGVNRGTADQPVFKLTNDPRLIPLGCFLRRWSLDELPQLWNVIAGDMSLVGPRPSVYYEVEHYKPWHFQRFEAMPGLTGLWQVDGRARTTFDDMVRMDVRYIRSWSLFLDLTLMARTFDTVLRRQGGL
jgi:lipopolysaccharide/colanic/teichoic acid biosynthesis glycosyltransferase